MWGSPCSKIVLAIRLGREIGLNVSSRLFLPPMAAWSITPFSSPLSRVRPPPGANPRPNHHIQDNHQPPRPRADLSGSVQLKNQHIVLCPPAELQNLNPILGSLEKERRWEKGGPGQNLT